MKHVTEAGLDSIDGFLIQLRTIDGLIEKKRGVFYRKSKAFLHFHEDGDDVYADCRLDGVDFDRRRVTTRTEQHALLSSIRQALA